MKRAFDIAVVVVSAPMWIPLFALVYLLVRIKLGEPVFFRQRRPGFRGRPFRLIKFRTMADARDSEGELLPDAKRMTPLGRLLRNSSLDELPELFNVLKGDMSIVGPRPLLEEYLPLYSPEQARRHEVRPGITGWAQVNGRNAISWEKKFELDVWYVNNQSFLLDLRIMRMTIGQVCRRRDISHQGEATMHKFEGNE